MSGPPNPAVAVEDSVGMRAADSPVGAGPVTGATERGFPQVNGVAVAWLVLEDGRVFDPFGKLDHLLDHLGEDARAR